jgi:hypothetical protein
MEVLRSSEISYLFTELHGVMSQMMVILMFTAVKTSNPKIKNQ